ncbi:hypothetical protein AVEN_104513-1 [Araneus ventricosus]|uniref:Reverse transcriptase domain-containing protein n=1 Tax=Araneus ventricosus TaxID=182803 RepID=A0A4Y2M704_ARAVE|nr:hypothetical protein AVEN_104513-1 [Araneus ventricosus]
MVRSPKITWNGYKINGVESFKYLGIHVEDRLNWLEHINKQGEKAISKTSNESQVAIGESLRYMDGLSIKRLLRECWPTDLQLGV